MLERTVKAKIDRESEGANLLDFLTLRFTYHDRAMWTELLEEGRMLVNGQKARASQILSCGMELTYLPRSRPEPEVSFDIAIIYEDEDFLVINKPGNLPCHPAGCYFNNTLWAVLKEGRLSARKPMDGIHFVNRLDRETSGIVLVAKHPHAAKNAGYLLDKPDAEKAYLVLVEGDFPETLEAKGWLFHDQSALVSKRRSFSFQKPDTSCEDCCTFFQNIRRRNGLSLVKAVLKTGRTHQIRATLSSLGFPVVGDKIYGVDETIFLRFLTGQMTDLDMTRLRMPRQALHAHTLSFGKYSFAADIPDVWPLSLNADIWAQKS